MASIDYSNGAPFASTAASTAKFDTELPRESFPQADNKIFGVFTQRCWNLFGVGLAVGFTVVAVLSIVIYAFAVNESTPPEFSEFARIKDGRFDVYCRPFHVVGFNAHDLMDIATLTPREYSLENGVSGRHRIIEMFNQASDAGLNVVRIWAHTSDDIFPFQMEPGKYNEDTFRGLDFILNEARLHGIKVIMSLIDNWKYYNGVDQFVDWSSTSPERRQKRPRDEEGDPQPPKDAIQKTYEAERHAVFFSDPGSKKIYRKHVQKMLLRKNTIHRRQYKDDPTILAWDLINEPRCEVSADANCTETLQSWIEEMSTFVKSLDPNHLVTIGAEGFYGSDEKWSNHNPGKWAEGMGQAFVRNHLPEAIDFASIHHWPDNWDRPDKDFQIGWIKSHVEASKQAIGKPLLLEEFGKKLDGSEQDALSSIMFLRDPDFNRTYEMLESNMKARPGAFVGTLFWRWYLPTYESQGRGLYGVDPRDTTFEFVKEHADFVRKVNNAQAPGADCTAGCWVPHTRGRHRVCIPAPHACKTYWEIPDKDLMKDVITQVWDEDMKVSDLLYFPTLADCCRRGLGGFPDGCTYAFGWVPN